MASLARSAAHVARVKTMYRNVLKTTMDWAVHRPIFFEKAAEVRAVFDSRKEVTDSVAIQKMLQEGDEWLFEHQHPEPYVFNVNPGGSKHDRNAPPAPELCVDPWENKA
ncbi:uncharacterized protein AMSG_05332 [Thecamonas trahens ATCC 50062]|uniref:NADH dehydrogenase [ubiquinone] 1 beta subcomplex subunit 9 n=1 Tax=Thecamonas trahens ATCC 50062 TaxID=461836 RepID=A0A0L0DDC9_THETB|nr:hypothetical protein AMSG_05332 [Thecamonas trahens ATCC 50062]KNC49333.1 hypothetical protein AMSG_05332 [Thecamonas trahens ATCC 50062]|eukprot:XP_013758041.1 hypothetical protein AMSG_05332 [Thecamonas trahens ATCC 50062]